MAPLALISLAAGRFEPTFAVELGATSKRLDVVVWEAAGRRALLGPAISRAIADATISRVHTAWCLPKSIIHTAIGILEPPGAMWRAVVPCAKVTVPKSKGVGTHTMGQAPVPRALILATRRKVHRPFAMRAAAVPPAGSPRASRPRAARASGAVGANPTVRVLATTTTAVVRQPWRGMPGSMGSMDVSGGMGGMGGVADSGAAVVPPSQLRRARTSSRRFRRDVPTQRWCEPAPLQLCEPAPLQLVQLVVTAARLAASLVERA